jgi:hypothetical protein
MLGREKEREIQWSFSAMEREKEIQQNFNGREKERKEDSTKLQCRRGKEKGI